MAAVLNNGSGFYATGAICDMKRECSAQRLTAPYVNHQSGSNHHRGSDIYLGMQFLNDLEERT